ncbi:glycosyltransferase family 2 protein [Flavisolibacter tropicus]|uniref:glycosyltransferase family 2 protein n=1 Tax=Flavisolibacter tropicus TaxID=1492898 RepID=UPI000833D70B|nr:glycosyltransferase family 2 protein [Flavisolibacter tropicus]
MDVSIIIINYNTYQLTRNCISSVIQYTSGVNYEIVLVDNASIEPEPVTFEALFPGIKVIRSTENVGFAKGNNLGISDAKGKYILLLNSDTVLKENSVKITYDYLEANPKVGVLSARLIFPDGKHQSVAQRFPSIRYQLIELFRIQKLMSKKLSEQLLLGAFFNNSRSVKADWVWGAYFMLPRDILSKLPAHKLDDTYFMYAEDMQWCKDIRKLGYEVHFYAGTEVIHFMGGSSGAKQNLMQKNNDLFLKRNYSFLHRSMIKILTKIITQ